MAKRSKIKITVLKALPSSLIFGDNPPMGEAREACSRFKVGQEFIVEEDGNMPDGFCSWAWNDIYGIFTTLRFGGNFSWMKEKGTNIACCTDGLRPVIFELRRIE
jgi:uncharacterized repeat protein (TIGR04076 family)